MSERIDLAKIRGDVAHLPELGLGASLYPISVDTQLALVEAVEAAHKIVLIEDLYRDLPPDVRAGSLPAFEPKHRQVMDEARAALACFDFSSSSVAGGVCG